MIKRLFPLLLSILSSCQKDYLVWNLPELNQCDKTTFFNVQSVQSYILPWGNEVFQTGEYKFVYITGNGCDSIVSYNVQIIPITSLNRCGNNNCDNLFGVTNSVYLYNGNISNWTVQNNGYNGSCYNGGGFGGYIEFSKLFTNNTITTFWMYSVPGAGYWNNIMPEIYVDGRIINSTIIAGNTNNQDWVQLKLSENILVGNHTIKIDFGNRGSGWNQKIDEIEFWCL